MSYKLSSLPPVDRVEVLRLGRIPFKNFFVPQDVNRLPEMGGVFVEGPKALEIADLWRSLPFAGQMRCHMPPLALRFFNEELILSASICWQCNNIWIVEAEKHHHAEFDALADVSQQLLRLLEDATAHSNAR